MLTGNGLLCPICRNRCLTIRSRGRLGTKTAAKRLNRIAQVLQPWVKRQNECRPERAPDERVTNWMGLNESTSVALSGRCQFDLHPGLKHLGYSVKPLRGRRSHCNSTSRISFARATACSTVGLYRSLNAIS
jgi:hypothetical protein